MVWYTHNLTAVNIKTMDTKEDDQSTRSIRELRWYRCRQVDEIRTNSGKLDESLIQRFQCLAKFLLKHEKQNPSPQLKRAYQK